MAQTIANRSLTLRTNIVTTPMALPITTVTPVATVTITTTDTPDHDASHSSLGKMPVMRSRVDTPRRTIARSTAYGEKQDIVARRYPNQSPGPSHASIQLSALARNFEYFFWQPSRSTQAQLMNVIEILEQSTRPLDGMDASTLVKRILVARGLFHPHRSEHDRQAEPVLLGERGIRDTVRASLECLASSGAKLFDTNTPSGLVYLLQSAEDNGLLPEFALLIASDASQSGEHKVLQSAWEQAECGDIPANTLPILIQLSEHLGYPVPKDVSVMVALQLLRQWHTQHPTDSEQDYFELQLFAMTGTDVAPDDFEYIIIMALCRGFRFTNDALFSLINHLIIEWDINREIRQYGLKLDTVLALTNTHADEIVIDQEKALSRAARTGHAFLLDLLLKHGADPSQFDARQKQASDHLTATRHSLISEIVEVNKARSQFTPEQYLKISNSLLSQLRSTDWMMTELDKAKPQSQ